MCDSLIRNSFTGDEDIRKLRFNICSENQFDGDARWHAGMSMKGMWLSLYEYANLQPLIEYWTTEQNIIAGVIIVSPDQWRVQASPGYRDKTTLKQFIDRADILCSMLASHSQITTQAYASANHQILVLEELGYRREDATEVFMACQLDQRPSKVPPSSACFITQFNSADSAQRTARALIQANAFSGENASDEMVAWHLRNGNRMQTYSANNIDFLAATDQGQSVAFASIQLDHINKIAEIEPVGTLTSFQRQGIAGQLLERCLDRMQEESIETAFVRTGLKNTAAIAAYESVGFEVQDYLYSYSRSCSN